MCNQDQDILTVRLSTGRLAQSGYLWGGAASAAASSSPAGTVRQETVARVLRERMAPDARRAALACVFFPDARTAAADEEGAEEGSGEGVQGGGVGSNGGLCYDGGSGAEQQALHAHWPQLPSSFNAAQQLQHILCGGRTPLRGTSCFSPGKSYACMQTFLACSVLFSWSGLDP